jgi:GTP-binding protein
LRLAIGDTDADEFDEDPEPAMDLDAEDDVETKPQSEA